MTPVRPDDRAFFDACLERPDDDVPRLIWADYMDETERPQVAAFMRGVRGPALLTAASELVQGGGDADRIMRLVLWLARGSQIAVAADQVAAQGDAVRTMRAVLMMAETGHRRFDDTVTLLKVGMHAAFGGAARAVKNFATIVGRAVGGE
jgi:uncharacterized protein (TIGR02996 family)